jgi:hypothetical protein
MRFMVELGENKVLKILVIIQFIYVITLYNIIQMQI